MTYRQQLCDWFTAHGVDVATVPQDAAIESDGHGEWTVETIRLDAPHLPRTKVRFTQQYPPPTRPPARHCDTCACPGAEGASGRAAT